MFTQKHQGFSSAFQAFSGGDAADRMVNIFPAPESKALLIAADLPCAPSFASSEQLWTAGAFAHSHSFEWSESIRVPEAIAAQPVFTFCS